MFDSVKRPQRRPANSGKPKPPVESKAARRFADPPPLPEVIEGNEQSDWDLWQDSVSLADSQFQNLESRRHFDDGDSGEGGDPFANVGKNRDL